jgi:hypothetical protein
MVVLFKVLNDPDVSVNDIAAACCRPLIQAFPSSLTFLDDNPVSMKQIAERLAQFPKEPRTSIGAQVQSEIRALLSPKAVEPVSKD